MLRIFSYIFLGIFFLNPLASNLQKGEPLPKWSKGFLDIYHMDEGPGNTTFMIFPDGTTLLYDIGNAEVRDNGSQGALQEYSQNHFSQKPYYEGVADFINNFSPYSNQLDYLVISHYHFDHMGEWNATLKEQSEGHYKLTGVTGLAEKIKIYKLIDRSYPNYLIHGDFPEKLNHYLNSNKEYERITALTMLNYQNFINYQMKHAHLQVERFKVGSSSQIHLVHQPNVVFKVINVIGDGDVWTGKYHNIYHFIKIFDPQRQEKKENELSNGIRIDYGNFRYFTGGDITGRDLTGKDLDNSAEALAAPAIGKVDVATMDHHGFEDSQSHIFVDTLRPSVWIQQNWAASQTGLPMILRTLHSDNSDKTDLFALHHFQLNDLSIPSLGNSSHDNLIHHYYKDSMGHILVRVEPGGKKFWVIMLTSDSSKPVVKAFYGPYLSYDK